MPGTLNGTSLISLFSKGSETLNLPGLAWPVELRPHPRARSVRLRLDEGRSRLLLTYPRKMSRRAALDWASKQSDWVDAQLTKIQPAEPFIPGVTIAVEGTPVRLHWDATLPRTPRLADGVLSCGGPADSFAGRIERFLRDLARSRLSDASADAARRAGVSIRSVSVGDAASRWGSCSANGALRYSWRIILAPPHLLNWLVAHEVAHRRHMNHGPEFRALEAELYGANVASARAELRSLGPRLKRIGRLL
ncbi:M48 family metallopeptidase [Sphingomonas sp. NSE70-1]|uniref:M48 family metallopeptidase n=1 Tax=Sphingomonas caseinilyticus TaxID=2908205 RepID=A0ABT0RUY5_9SPHN|nr:YgjP-like metallopeptidase domain-containing protein [Sphingomonas caseinilyticus]MCL6698815.1 M48 family metallopeptidase [Sphingomonas caseinilyticus]